MSRRKIIGISEVITERIKKEYKTKNISTQVIERKTVKAIKLECGHLMPVTRWEKKLPKYSAECWKC